MQARSVRGRSCAWVVAAAALAMLVVALPASANPAGTGLVISEVYGGGGNSGATYKSDFIELYNPTDQAISLSGKSVQYRSAGSTSPAAPVALTGSVPAKGHWLLQAAQGTGGTADLPSPDQVSDTPAISGTAGQVLLANGTAPLTPTSST